MADLEMNSGRIKGLSLPEDLHDPQPARSMLTLCLPVG